MKLLIILDIFFNLLVLSSILLVSVLSDHNFFPFLIVVLLLATAVYFTAQGGNGLKTAAMIWLIITVISAVFIFSGLAVLLILQFPLEGYQNLYGDMFFLGRISVPSGLLLFIYGYLHLSVLKKRL